MFDEYKKIYIKKINKFDIPILLQYNYNDKNNKTKIIWTGNGSVENIL